jgi:predicted Zn-dependent protease
VRLAALSAISATVSQQELGAHLNATGWTGYDPESLVDSFEKIESLEKEKPGSVAKVFSTHPVTDDRIKAAQEQIQDYLPERPEYLNPARRVSNANHQ